MESKNPLIRDPDENYIKIHCVTMNCAGQVPSSLEELVPLFLPHEPSPKPNIYIVGLQEIVKLNAKNIFKKDKKKVELWTTMLNQTIMRINKQSHDSLSEMEKFEQEYVFIDKSMVGCYICVFVQRNLTSRIKTKSFQICKVKTGNYGTTGNKGAVCIRFQIDD